MATVKITFLVLTLATILMECCATPGHHVRHRIHVPHKVKTVYHTKIVKVPEHHHHIYEKEKPQLIKVPEHHHYFHEKEKEEPIEVHDFHKNDHSSDHSDEYHHQYDHVDYSSNSRHHNVFKKHAPHHLYKSNKKRRYRARRIH